jgi:hypothetical protein
MCKLENKIKSLGYILVMYDLKFENKKRECV